MGYIMVVVEKDAWDGDEHGDDRYEYGMTWRLRGVYFYCTTDWTGYSMDWGLAG